MQSNVVYGMYSGLALLLDVYEPEEPNGYAVVFISGSGWSAPLGLESRELKHSGQVQVYAVPLKQAGDPPYGSGADGICWPYYDFVR